MGNSNLGPDINSLTGQKIEPTPLKTKTMVAVVVSIISVVVLIIAFVVIRLLRRRAQHAKELRTHAFAFHEPAFYQRDGVGRRESFNISDDAIPRELAMEEGRGREKEKPDGCLGAAAWREEGSSGGDKREREKIEETSIDPLTRIDLPSKDMATTIREREAPSPPPTEPTSTKPKRKPRLAAIILEPPDDEFISSSKPHDHDPANNSPPDDHLSAVSSQDESPRSKLRPSNILRDLMTSARSSFSTTGRGSFSAPRGSLSEQPSNFPKMMQRGSVSEQPSNFPKMMQFPADHHSKEQSGDEEDRSP